MVAHIALAECHKFTRLPNITCHIWMFSVYYSLLMNTTFHSNLLCTFTTNSFNFVLNPVTRDVPVGKSMCG